MLFRSLNGVYVLQRIGYNIHGLNKKNKYIEDVKNYVNNNNGCTLDQIVKKCD